MSLKSRSISGASSLRLQQLIDTVDPILQHVHLSAIDIHQFEKAVQLRYVEIDCQNYLNKKKKKTIGAVA